MQKSEAIEIHCLTEIIETCFVAMVLQGRHLISLEHSVSHQAVIDILKARFPQLDFGSDADQKAPYRVVSTEKAQRELGLHVRPIEETIIDGAMTAFQLGLACPQFRDSHVQQA